MMEFNMSAPIEIPHNRTKASYVLTVVSVLSMSLGAYNIYAVNNNPTNGSVICEQRNGDTNEVIHDEIDANFNSEFASKAGMIARLENLYGVVQDGYFIDIGIPEDYERANREFTNISLFNDETYRY